MHKLVLCCAERVRDMVEEVGHNLRGLGFTTEVVHGVEARSALIGREHKSTEPTIYVVCVQGTLKETVLKPLRQALATHGGPNEHLFVAVLDLSLPLSMVGQIRRFAEALAGMAKGGDAIPDQLSERRQWRELMGTSQLDRVQTRSYRTRPASTAHNEADAPTTKHAKWPKTATGPRPIVAERKPKKVLPTQKYKTVSVPVPPSAPEGRSASGKVKRHRGPSPESARRILGRPETDEAETKPLPVAPLATSPSATDVRSTTSAPVPGTMLADSLPPSRAGYGRWLGLAVVAAGAGWLWLGGGIEVIRSELGRDQVGDKPMLAAAGPTANKRPDARAFRPDPVTVPPSELAEKDPPVDADEANKPANPDSQKTDDRDQPNPTAEQPDAPTPSAEGTDPTTDAAADPAGSPDPQPQPSDGDDPEPSTTPARDADKPTAKGPTNDNALIDAAINKGRIRVAKKVLVFRRRGEPPVSLGAAALACRQLNVDGIDGWHLPYRRELTLIGAMKLLGDDDYWSRSIDKEDRDFIWVYDGTQNSLVRSPRRGAKARAVCVRYRPKT